MNSYDNPNEHDEVDTTRCDLGAERHVLGAILTNPDTLADITPILEGRDFWHPKHQAVWTVMEKLDVEGIKPEPTAVTTRLGTEGLLSTVDGLYVLELYRDLPIASQAVHHALTVAECARMRRLDWYAARVAQLAADPGRTSADVTGLARDWLDKIDATDRTARGPKRWSEIITSGMEAIESAADPDTARAVSTGLPDLDRMLGGGLKPGTVTVVAGRPGTGKSLLAVNIMGHAAFKMDIPGLMISLEMSNDEIYARVASAMCSIPLAALTKGTNSDNDWSKLAQQAGRTSDAPLWIDDSATMTLADIRSTARRFRTQYGIRILVIDYLQLITVPSTDHRERAVADLSRGIKILAKELDIPVILLAQLNRGPEQRLDQRPKASDLRESGAIEADADTVILVHRPGTKPDDPRINEADLIVDKNRAGPRGDIPVGAQFDFARFVSLAV